MSNTTSSSHGTDTEFSNWLRSAFERASTDHTHIQIICSPDEVAGVAKSLRTYATNTKAGGNPREPERDTCTSLVPELIGLYCDAGMLATAEQRRIPEIRSTLEAASRGEDTPSTGIAEAGQESEDLTPAALSAVQDTSRAAMEAVAWILTKESDWKSLSPRAQWLLDDERSRQDERQDRQGPAETTRRMTVRPSHMAALRYLQELTEPFVGPSIFVLGGGLAGWEPTESLLLAEAAALSQGQSGMTGTLYRRIVDCLSADEGR